MTSAGMARAKSKKPLAIEEMNQSEAIAAANYTSQYYFGINALEFMERLQSGSFPEDKLHLVGRVLSMINPVKDVIQPR